MFTGIISDVGHVKSVEGRGDVRFVVGTSYRTETIATGASIACGGVCLSVVDVGSDWFAVDASQETLSKTTLGSWRAGTPVNLERAMALGEEIGGHLVSGHVDGVIDIVDRRTVGGSVEFAFTLDDWLSPYVAPKGSIALDGVSLTVNGVADDQFDVNIIPHTQTRTTFGAARPGGAVNVEIDMLARYVRRALADISVSERRV